MGMDCDIRDKGSILFLKQKIQNHKNNEVMVKYKKSQTVQIIY